MRKTTDFDKKWAPSAVCGPSAPKLGSIAPEPHGSTATVAIFQRCALNHQYSLRTRDRNPAFRVASSVRVRVGPDLGGRPGTQTSHQQRASYQTVSILFLADANDRCLRDYDLVVAHC